MRALLLAALLATAALTALAPPAAACHPFLLVYEEHEGVGAAAFLDMGCSHELPYVACVTVWAPDVEVRAWCGDLP